MTLDIPALLSLAGGTLLLRPYVAGFLLAFLAAAARDLGLRRAVGFLLWGTTTAFAAEYASTRTGIPFGLYHYTGSTVGRELYLANVPLFDPMSFVFLAYASFCLARRTLDTERGPRVVLLAGALMMVLDVVIDPLAVRGDRWFLGRIFTYPAGGIYFGVPLSNFAGWALTGWIIVGGYVWVTHGAARGPAPAHRAPPVAGVALYYAVLLFNVVMTWWIGEWVLLMVGILVHAVTYLVLYAFRVDRSLRMALGRHDVGTVERVTPASSREGRAGDPP